MVDSNNLKVLVTGGAGYIGSMTSKLLAKAGFDVTVFDNLSTGHKSFAKFGNLIEGDLLNPGDIDSALKDGKFDAIVHFAALSLVGQSVKQPLWYYRHNIQGTQNLLNSMTRHGVANIVFSSTAATYGEPQHVPIDENHPTRPINPYGRSKLCIEWMLEDMARVKGLSYVALRYFNAAGADPEGECGEWHKPETHLIPNLLLTAKGLAPELKLFGTDYPTPDGTCIRDYVHVYDLAEAHRLALLHLIKGGKSDSINLGCNNGTSVKEMYKIACEVTGCNIAISEEGRRAGDPAILVASRDKASSVLGWSPKYDDPKFMVEHAWNFYKRNGFEPAE